jgi:putative component of toxin-antitoxin plasmid stabilization module
MCNLLHNGRVIYYVYFEEENILLLLGGNKNGQDKDINRARKILSKKIEA